MSAVQQHRSAPSERGSCGGFFWDSPIKSSEHPKIRRPMSVETSLTQLQDDQPLPSSSDAPRSPRDAHLPADCQISFSPFSQESLICSESQF